ncbi:MAG: sigma-70 family RNA polymerase sigma factor [Microlunatus sp.]|nr:sigma-70 family RNA polymerase sigma factor [Microlunatus sp.]
MEDLLANVQPLVSTYCHARLSSYAGGKDTADDVVQETLVSVFRSLPRYVDQGLPFAAWVYGIAARKIADAQRGVLGGATPVADLPDEPDSGPGPEDHLLTRSSAEELYALLDQLPERTREVLLLRAEGLSAEKAGAHLGLSAGSVRVAYHRGVAKLRTLAADAP